MKTVKIKFTDSFGMHHDGAVFSVSYGAKSVSKTETIGTLGTSQQSISVSYQFKYWHSQEAKDGGLQPIQLMDRNGQQSFGSYPKTENEIGDLEDFCLSQLINVVTGIDQTAVVIEEA